MEKLVWAGHLNREKERCEKAEGRCNWAKVSGQSQASGLPRMCEQWSLSSFSQARLLAAWTAPPEFRPVIHFMQVTIASISNNS